MASTNYVEAPNLISAREKVTKNIKRRRIVALRQTHFTFPPQLIFGQSLTSFLPKSVSVSSPISLPYWLISESGIKTPRCSKH